MARRCMGRSHHWILTTYAHAVLRRNRGYTRSYAAVRCLLQQLKMVILPKKRIVRERPELLSASGALTESYRATSDMISFPTAAASGFSCDSSFWAFCVPRRLTLSLIQ